MKIDTNAKPRQQRGFRLETLESELLLYDPGQTKTIYLNPTASLIWQMCDGKHTVDEIIALLQESYPDAAEGIPRDVAAALDQFSEHGAIEVD
jgi:hypothetical protein